MAELFPCNLRLWENPALTLQAIFGQPENDVPDSRPDHLQGPHNPYEFAQKLHALEVFLTDHPEWIGKVVLVQVAVPSRQDVEEYQNLRAVVNELVGRINGKFGKLNIAASPRLHYS